MDYKRADKRKHHIIYKTTCLITGRWYIGRHSTDDLNDGYIGSGTYLARSIRKYGHKNHVCEIIEHHPTRDALKQREAELVNGTRWAWINKAGEVKKIRLDELTAYQTDGWSKGMK